MIVRNLSNSPDYVYILFVSPFSLQMTTELYEADLEKALILSKLEYEQQKQVNTPVFFL